MKFSYLIFFSLLFSCNSPQSNADFTWEPTFALPTLEEPGGELEHGKLMLYKDPPEPASNGYYSHSHLQLPIKSPSNSEFKPELRLRNISSDTLYFYEVRNSGDCCHFQYPQEPILPHSAFLIRGSIAIQTDQPFKKRSALYFKTNGQTYGQLTVNLSWTPIEEPSATTD